LTHQNHRLFYFLIIGLTIGVLCSRTCLAGTTSDTAKKRKQHAATVTLETYPILTEHQVLKHKPSSVIVYQTDQTPLSNRQPLLLVHGLRAEYRDQCRWSKVVAHLTKDAEFNKKYKIYLVRYDSTADLSKTVPLFTNAFLHLYENTGHHPITILAMSLGGVLTYTAMQDPKIDSAISLLFAMATPFHGSPLFCADWLQYSLYKNLSSPITRIDHSLTYRLYFDHNENVLSDINWDNCDGLIPNVGKFHSRLPFGPSGTLTVEHDFNSRLAQLNQNSHIDRSKLITYAAYLNNPYLLPGLREEVERTILAPYTFLSMKVPAHLAREHPVLEMLNRELSRIIPAKGPEVTLNTKYPYGLNDGISPVSSSLFLSADVCRDIPLAKESDIARIKPKIDVRVARVFKNTDHLSFLDGYHPHPSPDSVVDELNPQQTAKPILDWILADLLDASNQLYPSIAKELKTQSSD
jgi:hypothetical protein